MKIGYVSDEHLDHNCRELNPQNPKFKKQIAKFIKEKLKPEKGDVLIMAGDQGNYNCQIFEYITQMKEFYKRIILVPGNHNMYLLSNKQKEDYCMNSFNKLQELEYWCDSHDVDYLTGTIVNINGIKIAGFGNWYNLPSYGHLSRWKEIMNDAKCIMVGSEPHSINYGYGGRDLMVSFDSQRYYEKQLKSLNVFAKEKCDILVAHVCPIIIPSIYQHEDYVDDPDNIFYMVDTEELVKETEAKVVVFGHQHNVSEFSYNNQNFKINAVGYPGEEYNFKGIQHFNISSK